MDYTAFLQNHFPPQSDASMGEFRTITDVETILDSNRIAIPADDELQSHLDAIYAKAMIGGRTYFLM